MTDRRESFLTTGLAVGAMVLLFVAATLWVYGVVAPDDGGLLSPMGALSVLAAVAAVALLVLAARRALQ